MTLGVGGGSVEAELERLAALAHPAKPIATSEYETRLQNLRERMKLSGMDAVYLDAGTNLYYFTGTRWNGSERLVGAIVSAEGDIDYLVPAFEKDTFVQFMGLEGNIACWEEHESPYHLFAEVLRGKSIARGRLGVDETTPLYRFDGLRQFAGNQELVNAAPVTTPCRMRKTATELALLQHAKDLTIEVHKSAARILHPGITTPEVTKFIDDAHRAVGSDSGNTFCIVLFGEATAYPHGVPYPQTLEEGDMVLIDTGCLIERYNSDITRTYVYGDPTARQREVWDAEKGAQAAAFDAAQLGAPCGDVDTAARSYLEGLGFGPGYAVPGLPHRTGHGIGLDIHEGPYLVRNDRTPLDVGMCFSNEPMICVYGEFGVRLEDHFYLTEDGPKWFTEPSHSIDDPFGLEAA